MLTLPGGFVGKVYEAAGFTYRSIDLIEGHATVLMDLNCQEIPSEYKGKFDFVTNIGTTEHVCNQLQAFKVVHDALKPCGIALHQVPFTGLFNHGLIKYEPKFFIILAHENGYEILDWCLNAPSGFERISELPEIPGSSGYSAFDLPCGILRFLIKKESDHEFIAPTDLDLRYVEKSFSREERAAISNPSVYPLGQLDGSVHNEKTSADSSEADSKDILDRMIWFCQNNELGAEPYIYALSCLGEGFVDLLDRIDMKDPEANNRVDDLIRNCFVSAELPTQKGVEIELGKPFIGTGWARADADWVGLGRNWRWIGRGGSSSVFLCLSPAHDYVCRTLIHDARPGPCVYTLRCAANGRDLEAQQVENIGDEWWHICGLSSSIVEESKGKIELSFRCGAADLANDGSRKVEISLRKIFIHPSVDSIQGAMRVCEDSTP